PYAGFSVPVRVRTMVTEAQIQANRRNAKKSTGPRTEAGKARASLNALKHGRRGNVVMHVLPQEDPRELGLKIQGWVEDLKPEGKAQRELVERAAKVAWGIDRAERCETARMTERVKKAQFRSGTKDAGRVCD